MKIARILGVGAAVITALLAGFVAYVAMQPAEFRITRSATMSAPAEEVFAQINNFHHWNDWSPWAKLDPAANNTFAGPTYGEGAVFKWSGNDEVGEGKMTITESRPGELVRIQLDFLRPMQDTSDTEFTFQEQGDQTVVTWTMSGEKKNFMCKAVCLFMDMDKMLGDQFEQGLASMKAIVEAEPKPANDQDNG
jgi:uncharacterized protein YndB with AHSA1/START domain